MECVKYTYPVSLGNDNLPILGVMKLECIKSRTPNQNNSFYGISGTESLTLKISQGHFTDSTFTQDLGSTVSGSALTGFFLVDSESKATISIKDKYKITRLTARWLNLRLVGHTHDFLEYANEALSVFEIGDTESSASNPIDITKFAAFPALRFLNFSYSKGFIAGKIQPLSVLTNMEKLSLVGSSAVIGFINSISPLIKLTELNILDCGNVNGTVEEFASGMAASRTSGTLALHIKNTKIKYEDVTVTDRTFTIKFGTSMVNPTAAETEQGYQIS